MSRSELLKKSGNALRNALLADPGAAEVLSHVSVDTDGVAILPDSPKPAYPRVVASPLLPLLRTSTS